jgi:hypothetical protein
MEIGDKPLLPKDKPLPGKSKFFIIMIVVLMLVLPVVSVLLESFFGNKIIGYALAGKWFLFWGVGMRLFTAGLKQVADPAFTASQIFHIKEKESFVVVRELGFANCCLGLMAIISLFNSEWRQVSAIGGGLYFGLAGIQHVVRKPENTRERVAMVSDLFIFFMMATYLIISFS